MGNLSEKPVSELRKAARAWRWQDQKVGMHRDASGWLKFFSPEPNMSVHDRIDDLIDEIERLRARI